MLTNLKSWFQSNTVAIELGLRLHANTLKGCKDGERVLPLSDLQLCAAVAKGMIPLPQDFMRSQVEVRIGNRHWNTTHYLATRGREIIDFVPGQFFAEEVRRISGIYYMLERAPQLMQVLTEEVVVLHGLMKDIKEAFSIEYHY